MRGVDVPTVGSLCAGIEGFGVGFEKAGLKVSWQVEINPQCQRVLQHHFPDGRLHDNLLTFPPTKPTEWKVDVITAGFPCQDLSVAGKRAGLKGKRSGLFYEIV